MSRRPGTLAAVLVFVLAAGACRQGEGDRCEVDDDCAKGLTCERVTVEGICRRPGGTRPMVDAAAPRDAAVRDAGPGGDAGPGADAATGGDAAPGDAVAPTPPDAPPAVSPADAAGPDAAPQDTASPDAAASDAADALVRAAGCSRSSTGAA
jgi:hypothetical protein